MIKEKIQLKAVLPYNLIATRKWLLAQGISRHSLDNALKSKKIQSLTTGVYARTDAPISWWNIICSLQKMTDQNIVVGGISSIELQGFGHYLSGSKLKTVNLYSKNKLPAWLWRIESDVSFKWNSTNLLWGNELENHKKILTLGENTPVIVSTLERAIFEMLMNVPKTFSFDHVNEIMQGMTSLSPRKTQSLLEQCKNIKVKRLFLWLAENQGYAWSKKLNIENLELGSGKRVIAQDGKLDKKYLITVPKHLHGK